MASTKTDKTTKTNNTCWVLPTKIWKFDTSRLINVLIGLFILQFIIVLLLGIKGYKLSGAVDKVISFVNSAK